MDAAVECVALALPGCAEPARLVVRLEDLGMETVALQVAGGRKAGYAGPGFGRLLSTESWFVFSALVTGGAFGALFAPAALNDLAQIILK